jgi:hypothetical protein
MERGAAVGGSALKPKRKSLQRPFGIQKDLRKSVTIHGVAKCDALRNHLIASVYRVSQMLARRGTFELQGPTKQMRHLTNA